MADLFLFQELTPTSPEEGQMWIKPTIQQIFGYDGTNIIPIMSTSGGKSLTNPVTVFINGIDRTELIKDNTYNKTDNLTNKVDQLTFLLWDDNGNARPQEGESIVVFDFSTEEKLFGGEILKAKQIQRAPGLQVYDYQITCVDYQKRGQRKNVVEAYETQTCLAIITDLQSKYGTDFSINNVQTGPTVEYISFNYISFMDCIKELASRVGYDFYVDYDKDIHFFAPGTQLAPYTLDDDNTVSGHFQDLAISFDKSQYRNRIIVQGGYYLSDLYTQERIADGTQDSFPIDYQPWGDESTEIKIYVDTGSGYVEKTWGWENDDDIATKDFSLNRQEKVCKNSNIATLSDGHKLKFTYRYKVPILTQDDDLDSQERIRGIEGSDGIYEFHISDSSIETIEAAHERAAAELNDYANPMIKGTFKTDQYGYKSGQLLTLNMASRNYQADYLIQSVKTKVEGGAYREYTVTFATRLKGLTQFLRELYENSKELIIRPDETLHDLTIIKETITASDAAATFEEYTPPFQYGPGGNPQGVWNEAQYG